MIMIIFTKKAGDRSQDKSHEDKLDQQVPICNLMPNLIISAKQHSEQAINPLMSISP